VRWSAVADHHARSMHDQQLLTIMHEIVHERSAVADRLCTIVHNREDQQRLLIPRSATVAEP